MPQCDIKNLFLSQKHLNILQDLLKKYVPTAEVWAYGSRVTGQAHEGSDLDLILRNVTDLSQTVDGWSDLIEAIQNSMLPMPIDIHLWSHLPESFYKNIMQKYVVLQSGKEFL
jgi:predicted nucleotidyltransferase